MKAENKVPKDLTYFDEPQKMIKHNNMKRFKMPHGLFVVDLY